MVAAISIGNLGVAAKPAVPALIRTLKTDEDFGVREMAAYALGQIGRGDESALKALTQACSSTNYALSARARDALNAASSALILKPPTNASSQSPTP